MNKKQQQGITLIEMMIAMVLGLLVMGSIIAIFVNNVKTSSENIRMIRLNQELRGTMTFISDELKRAGYSGDATNSAFNDDLNFDVVSSCLRYSYDENDDGVQQPVERFAFKLLDDEIQWGTNQVDDLTDCTNGNWQGITDANITSITTFTAPESAIPAGTINISQLDVTLIGELIFSSGTVSRTISETIRVRNEDAN